MKYIVLDTNFLLLPAQLRVDIFEEIDLIWQEPYQLFVLTGTLQELEHIAKNGGQKEKVQVKLTKAIIKTQNIKIVSGDQDTPVDDQLVDLSKEGYTVATQDIALRRRIKHNLILLRQKKYLIFRP